MSNVEEKTLNDLALILQEKTGLSNEQIREEHQEKMDQYEGLVGEKAAIYLVARDHDVSLNDEIRDLSLDIENIVEDMSDVVVKGELERVWDKNSFEKDGETNYVRNCILKDDTGTVKIALWGEKAQKVDKSWIGERVLVEDAYSDHDDYDGDVQVNVGDGASIEKIGEEDG